ncbi:MAG TPA: hypothetical protein VKB30_04020 [Candidatus Limnocylindrales bacterium]|nr:hypothetical protein [Candidatus Limnocylindrales bacterium]
MTPAIILLAVVVTAAGVIATSAREPRFAALGMIVALVGAAYVTEPLPGLVALAARLAGSALAGYLVWIALRGAPPPTSGWRVGWPGAGGVAIVAFAIGWLAAGSIATALAAATGSGPSVGAAAALAAGSPVPRAALGAALALSALAAAPVLVGRDVLRLGLGLLLLLAAAGLLRNVMSVGTDGPVELALAVLTALSGAGVAAVVARSLLVHGDLELRATTRDIGGRPHGDDAHPRPWPGMYGPYGPRRRALPPTPAAHPDRRRPQPPAPARPEPPLRPGGKGGYGTGWPGTH